MRVFKRGRVWYCYVYEDGVRIQRSTRCRDRKAAEARARELERAAADPDRARTASAVVGDALRLVVQSRTELARAGKRSTYTARFYAGKVATLSRLLEHDERGAFRPFPLAQFAARHVDEYISARRAERVSEGTIAKELTTLRLALKLARRAGIWKGDPAEVCPVGFAPEYKPRERALHGHEVQRLLAELVADRAARVAYIVATSACWRETELAERGDVDGGHVLIRGTKRRSRYRTVPVVTPEQRGLIAYAIEHAKGESPALFRPWPNARRDLAAACVRAGIARCSPNDLRRTFGTWLRQAGAPPDIIAPAMGHVDSRMVERVYGRLSTDALAARLALATGSLDVLIARWAVRVLGSVLELAGCIAGASLRSDSTGIGGPPALGSSQILGDFVPRDGIEPPTRGFSNTVRLWPLPRNNSRNLQTATVMHRRRGKGGLL